MFYILSFLFLSVILTFHLEELYSNNIFKMSLFLPCFKTKTSKNKYFLKMKKFRGVFLTTKQDHWPIFIINIFKFYAMHYFQV